MEHTKNICNLTGDQYRAAFACMAPKNDPRYYLTSIFISAQHKEIVATNGHMLYSSPLEHVDSEGDLIIEAAKIPVNVAAVHVQEHTDHSVLVETVTKSGARGPQFICKLIEAKYPDHKAVFPDKNAASEAYTEFSFNAFYLGIIQRVFGKKPVRFRLNTPTNAAVINTNDESMGSLLLMPCMM